MEYVLFLFLTFAVAFFAFYFDRRLKKQTKTLSDYADAASEAGRTELLCRIRKLEEGVVPDYEKAKEAARAVDDFNAGLSAIMNFDPMAAARKSRNEKNGTGGDGVGL